MRATSGNLRLDQKYTLLGCEYNGKYSENELTSVCWQCENCGKGISNIATVKGSVDGKEYRIGLDCAATLTGIEASDTAEAKKRMVKEAKFRKWIKEEMLYWVVDPSNPEVALCYQREVRFFDFENEFTIPSHDWRCSINKYSAALSGKKRELILKREVESEYVEGFFKKYYSFK